MKRLLVLTSLAVTLLCASGGCRRMGLLAPHAAYYPHYGCEQPCDDCDGGCNGYYESGYHEDMYPTQEGEYLVEPGEWQEVPTPAVDGTNDAATT